MLKRLLVCLLALLGFVQLSLGTLATTTLFPSCTGTNFPNFSYAKGLQFSQGGFSCTGLNSQNPALPINVTWFYYNTYPPASCGNPDLPAGDQCCHSTATSTITFYTATYVNLLGITTGTSTGNVTAGAFLGQSATYVLTLNLATPNLNCNTAYGQEARTGTVTLTINGGPQCLIGWYMDESCPGFH